MTRESRLTKASDVIGGKEMPGLLSICEKLSDLDQMWPKIAGRAIGSGSSLSSCRFTDDGIVLTVNAADAGVMQALKFRRVSLAREIAGLSGIKVSSIEVKIGRVVRNSSAKGPLPEYKRLAPILIDGAKVTREAEKLADTAGDSDLADSVARLKVIREKMLERMRRK